MPEQALAWHRAGRGAVLATVVETWGSAPRPVGSQLAISGDGDMAGSVSGGCVEGAVVVEAMEAVGTGTPQMLEFGVSDDEAFAVGLACGGRIRVWLEPVGGAARGDAGRSGGRARGAAARGLCGEHRDRRAAAGRAGALGRPVPRRPLGDGGGRRDLRPCPQPALSA
jgi:xanthine dehydrogenase accessory factor